MNSKRSFLKAGLAVLPVSSAAPPASPQEASEASYFTDAVLSTHDGKKVKFYTDLLKGKMVVINMMYTSCIGTCPANTASMKAVQQALGERVGKQIVMYSLSLRPEFDTPQALRDYVRKYGIGPGWTFLTGKPAEVDLIRRRLGFYDSDPVADADLTRHTGMIRVGNLPAGRWCMAPALGPTRQIVSTILGAA
jgi:protein SCO1/2